MREYNFDVNIAGFNGKDTHFLKCDLITGIHSLLESRYTQLTYCIVPVIPRLQFAEAVNRFCNL